LAENQGWQLEVELGNSGQDRSAIINLPHALSRGRISDGRALNWQLGSTLAMVNCNIFVGGDPRSQQSGIVKSGRHSKENIQDHHGLQQMHHPVQELFHTPT